MILKSVQRLAMCLMALMLLLMILPAAAEENQLSTEGGDLLLDVTDAQMSMPGIKVRVFNDANNNGSLSKNEDLVSGAVISLISYENGLEIVAASAATNAEGEVTLCAPAGSYTLRCELPPDYGYAEKGSKETISYSRMELSIERVQDAAVTLTEGEEAEFGIGAMEMAAIMGTVWHDLNGDGLWQDDEPGIPGMRITADGTRNGLHYETETDAEGYFEIRQIRNGTYNVAYHVPDGYVFTFKSSGPKEQRSIMTTEADRVGHDQIIFERGDVVDGQNIGLVTECVVEGVCFLDANYNGIYDEGEQVLPGVQVELFRQSNNKRLQTIVSDEHGVYRFGNQRGDTFKLKAILPSGYTFTINVPGDPQANQFAPRDGKREQTAMNIDVELGGHATVMVGAICYGSITGVVYYDTDFSGDWMTGEKIAQGVVVTLLDAQGNAIKSAKTNKNGAYTFDDLPPGQYTIAITPVKGYSFTHTEKGSIIVQENGSVGYSAVIDLPLGEDVTGMNAGLIVPATVSGMVFADENDNGLQDAGEKGLTGTIVRLMNCDGVVSSAEVKADGAFSFHPVKPGSYWLQYQLPEGAVYARVTQGGNAISCDDMTCNGEWFEASAGDVLTASLCGGLYLGGIDGYAFGDSDGSGMMDGNETALSGLTLTLTPEREDVAEITFVTGADGRFTLKDLRPGSYTLTVACPEGYVLSLLPDVTLPVKHGASDQSVMLRIGMGESWTEQPLGCVKPAAYTGYAWLDEDLDGARDAHERAAVGETVMMIEQRSGSVVVEMTTDENGAFRAEGLAPGMYTIVCPLETGLSGSLEGDSTFMEADGKLVMQDIAILEGTDADGALLGLVRETTLAGHVWLDDNGVKKMVSGAAVTLLSGGEAVAEAVTAADGLYTFDGLMPGVYTVSVRLPAGMLAMEPGDRRIDGAENISILTQNDVADGVSGEIDVEMAQHQLSLDIGSVKQGRLGDLCWLDVNGNGLQDVGDGGIPGVTIVLMRNGAEVAVTTSDQYGYYAFEKLYPGEYTLVVIAPVEVKPTQLRTDIPGIVSVLQETGESVLVPVVSGGANYAADLGFVLVKKGVYPAGYGEGATQDWTKIK